MSHSFRHPPIQREPIEANAPALLDVRDLASRDLVIDREDAHAQVARRSIDVEPTRFDDGICNLFPHTDSPNFRAVVVVRAAMVGQRPASLAKS